MKTKLEVVTGFLGSGKTIFINKYINTEVCKDKNILIILLENGVTKIETKNRRVNTIYLEEASKLEDILEEKFEKNYYDKVIIEFNGTMNLKLIGDIFKNRKIRGKYIFYGSIFVGEGNSLNNYLMNLSEIIVPFIQSSKLILLNNMSLINNNNRSLISIIENININAPLIISNSINDLEKDLKASKYFKENKVSKKLKALIYKKEIVYGKMG